MVTSERRDEPVSVEASTADLTVLVEFILSVVVTTSTTWPRTPSVAVSVERFLTAVRAVFKDMLARDKADSVKGMNLAKMGLEAEAKSHER